MYSNRPRKCPRWCGTLFFGTARSQSVRPWPASTRALACVVPNPCGDLPPSDAHGICCLPNAAGDEIECEDRKASDCVAASGVVKTSGTVCTAETCADVLPPNPDVMCCLPNATSGEIECEDRTASLCAAGGGVSKGAGVCAPTTCADVPPPAIQCCVAKQSGTVIECEDLTAEACAARGGVNMSAGTCSPDPCNP